MPRHQGKFDQSHTESSMNINYKGFPRSRSASKTRDGYDQGRGSSAIQYGRNQRQNGTFPHGVNDRMKRGRKPADDGFFTRIFSAISKIKNLLTVHPLEGPKSLRAISFCGGIGCTASSLFAISHVQKLLTDPPSFILLVYQVLFGIMTMVIEAKNLQLFYTIQPWMNTWFPFLTEPWGKGFLFLLMGFLGLSLWQHFLYVACAGGFMCCIGFFYLVVSCGGQHRLSTVGIELTQHPNRGGYRKLPQMGQHRSKDYSRYDSPKFGDEMYSNHGVTRHDDHGYDSEMIDSNALPHDTTLPIEFMEGIAQHNLEYGAAYVSR